MLRGRASPSESQKCRKLGQISLRIGVGAKKEPDFSDFDAIFGVSEQRCKILSHARLDVLHMCTLASGIVALWARSPLTVR